MAILQLRSKRKYTGGRYKRPKIRRLHNLGRLATHTKVDEQRVKHERVRGANTKSKLLSANKVNIYNPSSKKHEILQIKGTIENPANRHYVRRNILTKGCVVDTSKGKVKITSRPGQNKVLNGVLVK
ncbi:MAG: 30S ribosomal protein S8e [Candidatus Nanoarchaeia archaeon]